MAEIVALFSFATVFAVLCLVFLVVLITCMARGAASGNTAVPPDPMFACAICLAVVVAATWRGCYLLDKRAGEHEPKPPAVGKE